MFVSLRNDLKQKPRPLQSVGVSVRISKKGDIMSQTSVVYSFIISCYLVRSILLMNVSTIYPISFDA